MSQLMPSPKWKLVVDIGETEPASTIPSTSVSPSSTVAVSDKESVDSCKDARINEVVSLLGQHMPSEPASPLSSYLPGFMSLRLLLLRPSRTIEEEELVRTMLGSYSSYSTGGRSKSDIAVMLARDYMFLAQQQNQPQQQPFLCLGQSMMSLAPATTNLDYFGLSSSSSIASFHDSPALSPIPVSAGTITDNLSIVST